MSIGPLDGLAPALNFASKAAAKPGDRWGPRVIPDCQLFYIISGEAALRLGPREYRILPGECVFYGADSPHLLTAVKPSSYFSLHFSLHADSPRPVHPAYEIRDVPEERLTAPPRTYALGVDGHGDIAIPHHFALPGVEPLMLRIVGEYGQEPPGSAFLLRALTMELVTAVVRQALSEPGRRSDRRLEPALLAMAEQPARSWTVSELAGLCGYHPSYFTNVFFESFGSNPKQFLISERIRQAKQALLRGEAMETIAERLGYASIHYFSNNFKKMTGMTPGEFRQLPADRGSGQSPDSRA